MKERKTKTNIKVKTKKRKPKLRKKRIAIAVCILLYGIFSIFNSFTFDDFNAKTLDYSLDFPIQESYYNLVLESEKCSVVEKCTIVRLARQKEAPILCVNRESVPSATRQHLDEFTNVYVVGKVSDDTLEFLKANGLNVRHYRSWFGFLRTLI